MTSIDSTLQERGERYGSFEHHAKIAQDLQRVLHAEAGWAKLADDQRQALTVIMDKVARMLNGDPAYRDNWHDIVGYAKLVDDRMKRDNLAVFRANEATPAPMPEWPKDEQRIDVIGQNWTNCGEHYAKPEEVKVMTEGIASRLRFDLSRPCIARACQNPKTHGNFCGEHYADADTRK